MTTNVPTTIDAPSGGETRQPNYLQVSKGFWSWAATLDHKRIGIMYLAGTLAAFLAGGVGAGSLVLPSGERVELGEKPTTVGRLPECTISINDTNVSRHHAEIRTGTTAYVAVDLGSTNGTMVNGTRIVGEMRLNDGDIISFGSTHVRFEAS